LRPLTMTDAAIIDALEMQQKSERFIRFFSYV
jgi:hypothetical protein